ncbi:Carboxypeptidase [Mycena venus]|uniref:Carboxypeptidase n=1 Tax=Mycena venus TaxID=2733690 RepID=A0A8H7CW62_9AGAR|nr:Carboxypeptidase [Mycena venus]
MADYVCFPVPHRAMTREYPHIFPFNDTFEAELAALDETCGFTAFLEEYLVFPPKGPQPPSPTSDGECDMFDTLTSGMYFLNRCFNTYHITTGCPYAVDPITNPPDGVHLRSGVTAPAGRSRPGINPGPRALTSSPRVIERLNKTIIVSGQLDLTLPSNGTLLAIQNMTWNGVMGFQSAPADPFFVPYVAAAIDGEPPNFDVWSLAGTGLMGKLRAERGLTFVDVFLAGHQLPQWQPAAAFRQLEYALPRVESMSGWRTGRL